MPLFSLHICEANRQKHGQFVINEFVYSFSCFIRVFHYRWRCSYEFVLDQLFGSNRFVNVLEMCMKYLCICLLIGMLCLPMLADESPVSNASLAGADRIEEFKKSTGFEGNCQFTYWGSLKNFEGNFREMDIKDLSPSLWLFHCLKNCWILLPVWLYPIPSN